VHSVVHGVGGQTDLLKALEAATQAAIHLLLFWGAGLGPEQAEGVALQAQGKVELGRGGAQLAQRCMLGPVPWWHRPEGRQDVLKAKPVHGAIAAGCHQGLG
jgi:hypothetical protein